MYIFIYGHFLTPYIYKHELKNNQQGVVVMHKILMFLFLFASYVITGMEETDNSHALIKALPPELQKKIFCILINQPTQLYKIRPHDQQKKLVLHICKIGLLNTFLNKYTHSFLYINQLFKTLPCNVKSELACALITKSFKFKDCNSLQTCTNKIKTAYPPETPIETLPGIERYFGASIMLCQDILTINSEQTKEYLTMGADPNFCINKGHTCDNVPAPLFNLATSSTDEDHKKIELLIEHGADVNIKQSHPFMLSRNGASNCCLIQRPTPLAIALRWNNERVVQTMLKCNPKKLWAQEAFLTTNSTIKRLILDHPSLTKDDLDKGLQGALMTQNQNDVALLLQKGADPNKYFLKTAERTIEHIFHPDRYQPYDERWFHIGSCHYKMGKPNDLLNIPIPNLDLVNLLCQYGAHDESIIEKLEHIQNGVSQMSAMLKNNKK